MRVVREEADSPLLPEDTEPASVDGERAETLGCQEGGDGILPPGQHLHRHGLLPGEPSK